MNFEIRVNIIGDWVELTLVEYKTGNVVSTLRWQDKRDLSDKLLSNIANLLKKKGLTLNNITEIVFSCDSPYFSFEDRLVETEIMSEDSSKRCGFTAWQTGEIIAKTLNYVL